MSPILDSNIAKYGAGQGETPTSYTNNPSTKTVNSINWVFPSSNNIDFNTDGNLLISLDKLNSKITLSILPSAFIGADVNNAQYLNGIPGSNYFLIADSNNPSRLNSQVIANPPWAVIGTSSIWSLVLNGDWNSVYARFSDINGTYAKVSDINSAFLRSGDVNGLYSKISDTNGADALRALISDVNGADALRLLISDTNNTARINAIAIKDWNTNSSILYEMIANPPVINNIDTNWQTSWGIFDANLSSYYAKIADVNTWFAKTSDINSSFLRNADVNMIYVKQTDGNAWYAKVSDINSIYAKISDINGTYAKTSDINSAFLRNSDVNLIYVRQIDGNAWYEPKFGNSGITSYLRGDKNFAIIPTRDINMETNTASTTYKTLQDYINIATSSGRISGGTLSMLNPTIVTVSAGTGIIKTTDSATGKNIFIDWNARNLTITPDTTNYFYVDYNSGFPTVNVTTNRLLINKNSQFVLGAAWGDGVEAAHVTTTGMNAANWATDEHSRIVEVSRVQRASGSVISATNRNIISTAGVIYVAGVRQTPPAVDTTGTGRFTSLYRATPSGWNEIYGNAQLDNNHYDDGSGTLATLSNNKYGIHWIFILYDGNVYDVFGQGDYALSTAELANVPANLPDEVVNFGILAAKIIIQKGATSTYSVTSAYTTAFPIGSGGNHNDLAGLQGGATNEYYHLDVNNYGSVADLNRRFYSQLDANSVFIKIVDINSQYVRQTDGNVWYAKVSDINTAFLRNQDVNLVYVRQSDGNVWYIKISDTNNTARIKSSAIRDWNTNASMTIQAIKDYNTNASIKQLTIADANNTAWLQSKAIRDWNMNASLKTSSLADINGTASITAIAIKDWNTASSMPYTVISDPPWSSGLADINTVYVRQTDGNEWYIKITDSNNTGRLSITALADLNENFVPYIGATNDVNLNNRDLNAKLIQADSFRSTRASNRALGADSVSLGLDTNASGAQSVAMGINTIASGTSSTAFGQLTRASAGWSTAFGYNTTASGLESLAGGMYTTASGGRSTAFGYFTRAIGESSFAAGRNYTSNVLRFTSDGNGSIAMGLADTNLFVQGAGAIGIGYDVKALANGAVALGREAIVTDQNSVAIGWQAAATKPKLVTLSLDVNVAGFLTVGNGLDMNTNLATGDINISGKYYGDGSELSGISTLDTNWQTSYPTFDANMALRYYKQTDANNTFTKITDVNGTYAKTTDINWAFLRNADVNMIYVRQTDGNAWYAKVSDINSAFLRNQDVNMIYVRQTDGNAWYIKITDTNNTARIKSSAIRDWNMNASITIQAIKDYNTNASIKQLTIADANNTAWLKSITINDWNSIGVSKISNLYDWNTTAAMKSLMIKDWNTVNSMSYGALTDLNKAYYTQIDANVSFVKFSGGITLPALDSGKYLTNNGTTLSWGTVTSGGTDTNWQTSYPVFDANMALRYVKQSDGNVWYAKTSDINNTYLNKLTGGTVIKDLNVSSTTDKGVNIKSDFNKICFPANRCDAYIDWNGTAMVLSGG